MVPFFTALYRRGRNADAGVEGEVVEAGGLLLLLLDVADTFFASQQAHCTGFGDIIIR